MYVFLRTIRDCALLLYVVLHLIQPLFFLYL